MRLSVGWRGGEIKATGREEPIMGIRVLGLGRVRVREWISSGLDLRSLHNALITCLVLFTPGEQASQDSMLVPL